MAWHDIDMPPGRSVSACRACGEIFTCTSAFDRHQTHDYGTAVPTTCHDPEKRGLVLHEKQDKLNPDDPWSIWGWPAAEGDAADWYTEESGT